MNNMRNSNAGAPMNGQAVGGSEMVRRILVVEDDEDIRALNREVLVNNGFHVDVAEDGDSAWTALNSTFYDLVITDNDMPKVTGIELIGKLHAARMVVPVILATGIIPEIAEGLQLAAMLQKPYTMNMLLDTVRETLRMTEQVSEQMPPSVANQPRVEGYRF
jgi:DNA-binding response OmpR family regulator